MRRSTLFLCSVGIGLLQGWVLSPSSNAETILGPAPGNVPYQQYYYRFSNGYQDDPNTIVNDSTFYLNTFDFSGVGWKTPGIFGPGGASGWSVAMIDSIHFIGAWHVHSLNGVSNMSVGDTLNFRPAGSTTAIVQATIANLQQVPNLDNSGSDVMLGTLSAPFPAGSGIAAYARVTAPPAIQTVLYSVGRQSEVGRNNFSGTINVDAGNGFSATSGFLFDYDQPNGNPDGRPSTVGADESHYDAGDSGGPNFIVVGGQLELLGAAALVGSYEDFGLTLPSGVTDDTAYSIGSYLPSYNAQIDALIAVPEPSSLALGLMAAAGAGMGFLRSRRRLLVT